jgi:hypothetical protein
LSLVYCLLLDSVGADMIKSILSLYVGSGVLAVILP